MKKLIIASLVSWLMLVWLSPTPALSGEKEYPPAPDFTLTDLNGQTISLADFEGKVIFLNFWATWCPPCRQEIPGFIEVYEKYKDKGMIIIGVSVDRGGADKVKEFVNNNKITYPIAMYTDEIIKAYQPGRFIPTTIIIDKQRKIRNKHVGYMDRETLEKYFLDLNK
ncbi:TlpA family protein disulfide reductase [Candidatus Aminicenantes bacterium AC-334-K16]|jgi:cytochrome c biogenesis protein CcmG/thiol:disulfide interchange protein DsbE|nr:TlpA family protein disulfide reductase [Candidatus Aminicenantes bacterium AC-334-K16]